MSKIEKWEILNSEIVFHNEWVTIQRDAVKMANGNIIEDYYVNVRPEVVLTFPVTKEGKVVMVRQYKHGAKEIVLEFPGGVYNSGSETAPEAALREMREETGYHSDEIIPLGVVYDDPTKDSNSIHFFLALNAEKKFEPEPDPTENIETFEVSMEEIPEFIKANKMKVSGSIALYTMAAMKLGIKN